MTEEADPLAVPVRLSAAWRPAARTLEDLPAVFTGGWVGYTGYDTVRYVFPGARRPGLDPTRPPPRLGESRRTPVCRHPPVPLAPVPFARPHRMPTERHNFRSPGVSLHDTRRAGSPC